MEFRNTPLLDWIRMTWDVVEQSVPKGPIQSLTEIILLEIPPPSSDRAKKEAQTCPSRRF